MSKWNPSYLLYLRPQPTHLRRPHHCCESCTPSTEYVRSLLQTSAGCWVWNHTPRLDTLRRCFHVSYTRLLRRSYQTLFRQIETKVWRRDCDPEIYVLSGLCWCLAVERIDLRHQHRDYPQWGKQCIQRHHFPE